MLTVTRLHCEYHAAPLGIDVLHPRLGWELTSSRRSARQTACQIAVAASDTDLQAGRWLWDSGKLAVQRSYHHSYAGLGRTRPPLGVE